MLDKHPISCEVYSQKTAVREGGCGRVWREEGKGGRDIMIKGHCWWVKQSLPPTALNPWIKCG